LDNGIGGKLKKVEHGKYCMISRRLILRGLIAAPSVVAFSSLMPIRGIIMPIQSLITITNIQDYERALRENEVVTSLQAHGIWDKLEQLWIFDREPIDKCRIK
jgi:hypothetical protein